jgi:hypothetical protein
VSSLAFYKIGANNVSVNVLECEGQIEQCYHTIGQSRYYSVCSRFVHTWHREFSCFVLIAFSDNFSFMV